MLLNVLKIASLSVTAGLSISSRSDASSLFDLLHGSTDFINCQLLRESCFCSENCFLKYNFLLVFSILSIYSKIVCNETFEHY